MLIEDIGRAAEIHVFAQRKAYRGILNDQWLFQKTTVAKRAAEFTERFYDTGRESFVYEDGGVIKGFLIVKPSPDADKPQAMEIERIFVDPLMQGEGIGTILLKQSEEIAKLRGYGEICLWVLEDNSPSRRFYEKYGYHYDNTQEQYMDAPIMHVRYIKEVIK